MKKNVGQTDRVIRLILAVILVVLYFTQVVTGTLAIIVLVGGIVLAATSFFSICGVYALFGISTCKVPGK